MTTQCPRCKGKKYVDELDILKAQRDKVICPVCNGFGTIAEVQTDGMRVGRVIAETFMYQELKDSKVISTLEVRVRPIMQPNGRPAVTPPKVFGEQPRMQCFIEIVRMNTKPGYRKQGIMRRLLKFALGDPKIEWAVSSWDDSTADGRNLLLGMKFKQEGNDLIWRPSGKDSGNSSQGSEQPEDSIN